MTSQPFVSSLSAVLTLTVLSAGAGAQTPAPSASAPQAAPQPPLPPGSVPIEPERREPGQPAARPAPARPPPGTVEFIPSEPSVSLLTQSGVAPVSYGVYDYGWWGYGPPFVYGGYAPVFTSMCRGRCTVSMEPGTYELALEKNGRVVRAAPTNIPGSGKLYGNFVDHSGIRTTGIVIGVVGSVAGVVMMIASYHHHVDCDPNGVCFDHNSVNDGLFIGGLGTLIGSVITSSILASVHDRAEITITPLRLSSTPRFQGIAFDRGVTEGAALSIKF